MDDGGRGRGLGRGGGGDSVSDCGADREAGRPSANEAPATVLPGADRGRVFAGAAGGMKVAEPIGPALIPANDTGDSFRPNDFGLLLGFGVRARKITQPTIPNPPTRQLRNTTQVVVSMPGTAFASSPLF